MVAVIKNISDAGIDQAVPAHPCSLLPNPQVSQRMFLGPSLANSGELKVDM